MDKQIIENIHNTLRAKNEYSETQIVNCLIEKVNEKKYRVSIPIPTTKFIEDVLIKELLSVTKTSAWLSFLLIGSGIEFLGKCIDAAHPTDWDIKGRSSINFNDAICSLNGLNKYIYLINRADGFNMYTEFRCGLTHGLAPKAKVSLSHGKEDKNLNEKNGIVNFNIDELYIDFKLACEDVISRTFPNPNKMNGVKAFINCEILIS
jgi:hypothetical protein